MKMFFIGIIVLIALIDYALIVACSHLEDRDAYEAYERWKEKQKGKSDGQKRSVHSRRPEDAC